MRNDIISRGSPSQISQAKHSVASNLFRLTTLYRIISMRTAPKFDEPFQWHPVLFEDEVKMNRKNL